ncbi:hypothetical protein ACO1O0_004517 [Amphichorda felina]
MAGSTNNNHKKRAQSPAPRESPKKNKVAGDNASAPALPTNMGATSMPVLSRARTYNTRRDTGMVPSSAYGQSYQHSNAYTSPSMTPAQPPSSRCGFKIGPVAFEQVNLHMPPNLSPEDRTALGTKWEAELERQAANPPALPPSRVPALPPKEMSEEYLDITDDIPEEEKVRRRDHNNRVSASLQRIERERNNQAAKKSRETRLEALRITREILNRKEAECAWMRLKVIELGGSADEWDAIPEGGRARMVQVVEERVNEADLRRAEDRKKEESHRRSERNRLRAEQRDRSKGLPASASPVSQSDGSVLSSPPMGDVNTDFMTPGL